MIDPHNNNQKGRGYTVHCKVTVKSLAELFGVHPETIRDWIRSNRVDPSSLVSIVRFYNEYNNLQEKSHV